MPPRSLALITLLCLATTAAAQSERYELAARLKAFETEWEKQTDPDARKRAMKVLPDVTSQFFTFQFGKAGQTLDTARLALLSDRPPSDAVLWATSLYPEVKKRIVTGDEVEVTIKQFYSVKADMPEGVSVRYGFDGKTWTTAEIENVPVLMSVPLPEKLNRPADLTLRMEVLADGKTLASRTVGVSAFDESHLKDVSAALEYKAAAKYAPSPESASLVNHATQLKDLADGIIPESDVSAATRFAEMTELLKEAGAGRRYFTPDRPGDHWVSIPTGEKGKTVTPCRLFVPEKLDAKTPVPIVVAMHGAGGSENMFFESYGAGHIVKLCKERGWLLVSPRAGLGFGLAPAPPVGDIVDVLATRYPIDPKRVFILGHSMGSSMAFDAVQKHPGKFASVACLGGGGTVRKPEAVAELSVFIGVGEEDIGLRQGRALHKALEKAGAKNVTLKEYPDVEHLVIVRAALGDVFERFDKVK